MSKEIPIRCKGNRYLPYEQFRNFQGNLKAMSKVNAEKLKKSILKRGWIAPVFVWNNNHIIDGHGRLHVLGLLLKEGYTIQDIPVVDIQAKNKKEAAEILLAVNSNYQTITDDGLYEFMHDMDLTFEDVKNDFILPDITWDYFEKNFYKDGLLDDDDIPEVAESTSKTGDLWLLGEHRLLCGDATKKEDVRRLMDGKSADMVFTDPPYGVSYVDKNDFLKITKGYGIGVPSAIKGDHYSPEELLIFLAAAFSNIAEAMKRDASYYVMSPQGGEFMYIFCRALIEGGLKLKHMLVWVKDQAIFGRADYKYQHEPILYGWKDKHKFYGDSKQTSVWNISKHLVSALHPTMKPVELIMRAISNSSRKTEIVLDTFMGSGSTLIACEKTGRICYGMEIDPHYCDVIVKRWQEFTGQVAKLAV